MQEGQQLLSPPPTIRRNRGGQTGVASVSTRGPKAPGLQSQTGPQDEESRVICEASRQRLQQQRLREREERRRAGRDRRRQNTVGEVRAANAAAVSSVNRGMAGTSVWQVSTATVRGLEWPRRDAAGDGLLARAAAVPAGGRRLPRSTIGHASLVSGRQPVGGDRRREEWEENVRRDLRRREAEETARETARREEETTTIAMPTPGRSTWHVDMLEGDRQQEWEEYTQRRRGDDTGARRRSSSPPRPRWHVDEEAATVAEQKDALVQVIRAADKAFQEKKTASDRQCEHRHPRELDELTPLEEKLISLNSAYGFITKFNIQRGRPTGLTYRKHVMGHITVFPNDVESLAARVLPHPLLATLEEVHVVWMGPERPTPQDVSKLLSAWAFEGGADVPVAAYNRMAREEETAADRIRTANIVPPSDRGRGSPHPGRTAKEIVEELVEAVPRPPPASMEEAVDEETAQLVFELRSTGMLPIDGEGELADQDKLYFVSQAFDAERQSGERPFIRVWRGRDFADSLSPDFFPKTFPTCFPYGRGGSRAVRTNGPARAADTESAVRDMSLESRAKAVRLRHGGRFSRHSAFAFLVFNILARSRNRWVAQGRVERSAFRRVGEIYKSLSADRLRQAQQEMFDTGRTSDTDFLALMKELSFYGSKHPLSNESRLCMRKKIFGLIIATGLTVVWFTINPNDINNPVKLKLAAHRELDDRAVRAKPDELETALQSLTLSIHDPLSSTLFFFREVSDYYATVETNDRGALHLHELMWFDADMGLPTLLRDITDPKEEAYRAKVRSFVDDVFTETLDDDLANPAAQRCSKSAVVPPEAAENAEWLSTSFQEQAYFVASRCQVHQHSATCVKYSFKDAVKDGGAKRGRPLCRFGAPWKLVPETGFTEDGLLHVERNPPMVNRYNQSMGVGLWHNHDISLILTRSKGLSLMWYICNYATKLNAPMWKRLAIASKVLELVRQQQGRLEERRGEPVAEEEGRVLAMVLDETMTFMLKISNRVFSSRELSQPEVLAYLLGFGTDFSSVRSWAWVHLNSLYWACARRWPALCDALAGLSREPSAENVYFQHNGFKLPYLEAYRCRGRVLEGLCFYEYLCFLELKKKESAGKGPRFVPFPATALTCAGWVEKLRLPGKASYPVLDGRLTDHLDEQDEKVVKWYKFSSEAADDIPELWRTFEGALSERLRFHVRNITLLRVSSDDATANQKLRGLDEDFEGLVDIGPLGDLPEEGSGVSFIDETPELREYWNAFSEVLCAAASRGNMKDMVVTRALRALNQEVGSVDIGSILQGEESPAGPHRGRGFYRYLQDVQNSPLRSIGLLGLEEVEGIAKLQRKEDSSIKAGTHGAGGENALEEVDKSGGGHGGLWRTATSGEPRPEIRVEVGPYTTYTNAALALTREWTLNKQQSLALLLPAIFLDVRGPRLQEDESPQHLKYVGGEGGTGRSRVIRAIQDMFRRKGRQRDLLLTGASSNAAALIGGVTLHSAANIGFEGRKDAARRISEEEKLRWKSKVMLIVDEISQVGGLTLAAVDSRLRQY
ncbi:Helitron helicase-like domain at N-terminus-domain-containing protein [Apiospora kogelbergensis]|uniref:ATP-dependent DNA helicase n=1 Tax=Apiospora kogelbergensis TaxID=1337665 RepID=A0AAW0R2P3_9PEZI